MIYKINDYSFYLIAILLILNSCNTTKTEYFETGEIKSEYTIKDKSLNGLKRDYYINGNLKDEVYYVNGLKQGLYKGYLENGKLIKEVDFLDGKQTGKYIEYFENGNFYIITEYIGGLESGVFKQFYENGSTEFEIVYENGKKNGKYIEYFRNGNLRVESNYSNDIEHGTYKSFFLNGVPNITVVIDSGISISQIVQDSLGNIVEEIEDCSLLNIENVDVLVEFRTEGKDLCLDKWEFLKISFNNETNSKFLGCIFPFVNDCEIKEGENSGEFYLKFNNEFDDKLILIVSTSDFRTPDEVNFIKEILINIRSCN